MDTLRVQELLTYDRVSIWAQRGTTEPGKTSRVFIIYVYVIIMKYPSLLFLIGKCPDVGFAAQKHSKFVTCLVIDMLTN